MMTVENESLERERIFLERQRGSTHDTVNTGRQRRSKIWYHSTWKTIPDALSERDVIANRCKSIVESVKRLIVVFSVEH